MIIQELLNYLKGFNIDLWTKNGELRFKAPKGALTQEIRDMLKAQKSELIEYLQCKDTEPAVGEPGVYGVNDGHIVEVSKNRSIELIDKKYVHKHEKKNVLVYNLRRVLPRKIPVQLFDNTCIPALSKEEKAFLLKYYSVEKDFMLPDEAPYYILHSIPPIINLNNAHEYLKHVEISEEQMRLLHQFYFRDKKTNNYILKENISDQEEVEILNILKHNDWHISETEKAGISDILERFPEVKKVDLFYANMYVDPTHNFFFEHPNEHVPGLMIIEAARQLLSACLHKYYNIPFKNVNFIFDGMQVYFKTFLELNYPITIKIEPNDVGPRPGYLIVADYDVTVLQKNIESVNFNFTGSVVDKNLFRVARNGEKDRGTKPRFHTRSIFYHNISIRDKNKKKHLCSLMDLSETGFKLHIKSSYIFSDKEEFEFFIYFQEIGFVQGSCKLVWQDYKENIAGFNIMEIHDVDLDNLREAIKRLCYVREEREIR